MTKEDREIAKAFIAMIKRNGWNSMKSGGGLAWFGGKTHHQLADHLPNKALDGRNHEDIDYLVVGWRT